MTLFLANSRKSLEYIYKSYKYHKEKSANSMAVIEVHPILLAGFQTVVHSGDEAIADG